LSLLLFPTWIVDNDINLGSTKVIQWVSRGHKVLTHGQERFFRKIPSVSIHSSVEWLDTFSFALRPGSRLWFLRHDNWWSRDNLISRSSFRSYYRRWWSLPVKRNIRQFDFNYSLFVDL
jgi:hypothetical protein